MAIASSMVWEFRTTGSANMVNGGGFKPGASGTDYSLQDTAQYALTGIATSGAGDTFLTASAAADMVGNTLHVISGTNFTVGWYEIIAVSVGVSVQVDRNLATGVGASGVINIGGALSLNSTLDDSFFESLTAGNTVWFKAGTYTLGQVVSVAFAPTSTLNVMLLGYNTTRGDDPTGTSRPLISCGANSFTLSGNWILKNIRWTGSASTLFTNGPDCYLTNMSYINNSVTTTRVAYLENVGAVIFRSEFVSQNGTAISMPQSSSDVVGCYIHDSDIGILNSSAAISIVNCIFEDCKTAGISNTGTSIRTTILGNTFYGAETTPVGIGIRTTGATGTSLRMFNNIFYGLATGIEVATVQQDSIYENFNDFFNNTTNRTLIATGPNSLALNPQFIDATQITGSTATTSGSVLTQSGGAFGTVTDNVDYLRVVSGTGVTVGIYLITSHTSTTLTVNNALGTSSAGNVVYVVYTGHNYGIGANLKAQGYPGNFYGSDTIGYLDMGAAQRQEPTLASAFGG